MERGWENSPESRDHDDSNNVNNLKLSLEARKLDIGLRVFHGNLIEESYTIKVAEIWHAIEVSRKYLFHLEKLEEWFKGYVEKVDKKLFEL
jgi:hypothetical protein